MSSSWWIVTKISLAKRNKVLVPNLYFSIWLLLGVFLILTSHLGKCMKPTKWSCNHLFLVLKYNYFNWWYGRYILFLKFGTRDHDILNTLSRTQKKKKNQIVSEMHMKLQLFLSKQSLVVLTYRDWDLNKRSWLQWWSDQLWLQVCQSCRPTHSRSYKIGCAWWRRWAHEDRHNSSFCEQEYVLWMHVPCFSTLNNPSSKCSSLRQATLKLETPLPLVWRPVLDIHLLPALALFI